MALLIDVQEVPWRILEAVKARILANREAKRRREKAEEVKGLTRPRPQRKEIGATMSTYRRPEPAPLVLGDPAEVALAWVYVGDRGELGGELGYVWIDSGDRSSRIAMVFDYTDTTATAFYVFPVGGNTLLFVHTSLPLGAGDGIGARWQAAVASLTAVREITVPTVFKEKWEATPIPDALTDNEYTFPIANYNFSPFFNRLPTDVEIDVTSGNSGYAGTPGWYSILLTPPPLPAVTAASAEADVATYAWAKRNFLSSAPTPAYALAQCVRTGTCPLGRIDWDQLTTGAVDDEFPFDVDPSLFTAAREKSITVDTSVPLPVTGGFPQPGSPLYAWDWGKPSYCRQQLLALGFTEADLRP
jgi:hypothetical protein